LIPSCTRVSLQRQRPPPVVAAAGRGAGRGGRSALKEWAGLKSLGRQPMKGPWSGGTMRWHRQRTSATAFVQPTTAFVLSGGGSLGAMQAGQLRALLKAGITPDLGEGRFARA